MNTKISDTVYGIGVDTGGTYTDAVLLDLRRHQVISDIEAFLIYLTMGTIIRS